MGCQSQLQGLASEVRDLVEGCTESMTVKFSSAIAALGRSFCETQADFVRSYDASLQVRLGAIEADIALLGAPRRRVLSSAGIPTQSARPSEMRCREFWRVAADVRARLPHVMATSPRTLAICDRPVTLNEQVEKDFAACWSALGLSPKDLLEGQQQHVRFQRALSAPSAGEARHAAALQRFKIRQ